MAAEIYFNVAVSGVLTGLVYGLMAVGLSVIFGVVRVVNFAHGEMMTIAMYLAIVLFSGLGLDPLVMVVPLAGMLFALGYAMQAGIINPFITRPEYSQFILLVAVAIIITNVLLIVFGPDARNVQTQVRNVKEALDIAKATYATDETTGGNKLAAALTSLQALTTYLQQQQGK